jgi:phytoene dehydrogenase-like protein
VYQPRVAVVGSGPNGLAAAAALARAGHPPIVFEADAEIGGGLRSAALTRPGYLHDVCAAVHPLGVASPFFRGLPLAEHGLEWVHPDVPMAHPFDDGTAAELRRSPRETADTLDASDRRAYTSLVEPLLERWDALLEDALSPLLRVPDHPLLMARFGLSALRSAVGLARSRFSGPRARALFAGLAAHTFEPLESAPTAAFGLVLGLAGHAVGWPFARGGSGRIATALAGVIGEHGGEIVTGKEVTSLGELGDVDTVLLDLTPRQVLRVAGERLPAGYRRGLGRYRYGPGVFKVDWALSQPIPWRAEACRRAGTVHLGGTLGEIAASARGAWEGRDPERPFVLVAQPTLFDPSRAPEGRHVAWGYIHVPHGSDRDFTDRVEAQIERFAPGFRDVVLERAARTAAGLEAYNPNMIGGDINGGAADLGQLLFRPAARLDPYATPVDGLYLCSASTPPGGGVHGMCGFHAASSALRRLG